MHQQLRQVQAYELTAPNNFLSLRARVLVQPTSRKRKEAGDNEPKCFVKFELTVEQIKSRKTSVKALAKECKRHGLYLLRAPRRGCCPSLC